MRKSAFSNAGPDAPFIFVDLRRRRRATWKMEAGATMPSRPQIISQMAEADSGNATVNRHDR